MAYSQRPDNAPIWADTGDKTRPAVDNDIAIGWPQATTPPPRQKWNWLLNQLARGMRYYLQQGIPEWSVTEEYQQYAYVKYLGVVYRSMSSITGGTNPFVNVGVWEKYGLNTSDVNALITASLAGYATLGQVTTAVNNALAIVNPSNLPPGSLGILNNGKWKLFVASGSFTVPAGITQIRVRVVGGGGAGQAAAGAGSGGGYAHGLFTVVPGAVYAVTVGAGGVTTGQAGATSSFGALISATGGASNGGAGGTGTGGDFQAAGGTGGSTNTSGGGGAGSQLGVGGNGYNGSFGAGAGVGGVNARSTAGSSPFGWDSQDLTTGGMDCMGGTPTVHRDVGGSYHGAVNPSGRIIRFPFDGFTGGGGSYFAGGAGGRGGIGCGGAPGNNSFVGGAGGIGGGGASTSGGAGAGGMGGGGGASSSSSSGAGGTGLVVVEW